MTKEMKKNEIRVIKLSGDAIDELIWELMNKEGEQFLSLPDNSNTIFRLVWDRAKDELVFYALEFEHPHPINFEAIDRYINKHIRTTTDSMFSPDIDPFKVFFLDDVSAEIESPTRNTD